MNQIPESGSVPSIVPDNDLLIAAYSKNEAEGRKAALSKYDSSKCQWLRKGEEEYGGQEKSCSLKEI